ncbi:MAG: hypothetical protein J7L23_01650 [Candidatus Diapherotrites archaeon]|nr:hypothetical protein [Candidatus Diapherotrites archaeon]
MGVIQTGAHAQVIPIAVLDIVVAGHANQAAVWGMEVPVLQVVSVAQENVVMVSAAHPVVRKPEAIARWTVIVALAHVATMYVAYPVVNRMGIVVRQIVIVALGSAKVEPVAARVLVMEMAVRLMVIVVRGTAAVERVRAPVGAQPMAWIVHPTANVVLGIVVMERARVLVVGAVRKLGVCAPLMKVAAQVFAVMAIARLHAH